jgi:uncharacterized membrane protein YsdA (DUF1294 family)
MSDPFFLAALAFLLVNGWTFVRFWQDKQRSRTGGRRISESDLLGLALIGGSPAALLARHFLRHKTRKQPFTTQLFAIVALQLAALTGFAVVYT